MERSVHQQIEAGLDIFNDGEMSKVSYSTHVTVRHFQGDDIEARRASSEQPVVASG